MRRTIKDYAKENGLTRSVARYRLEKMVKLGKATQTVCWENHSTCWRQLPSIAVNMYEFEA